GVVDEAKRVSEPSEAIGTIGEGDAQPGRFGVVPAGAEAEISTALGQHVEGRCRLDENARLPEVHGPHEGPSRIREVDRARKPRVVYASSIGASGPPQPVSCGSCQR